MSKLTEHDITFIGLIHRSEDIGDGWRQVSVPVWPLVDRFSRKELLEIDKYQFPVQEIAGKIRLSDLGKTILGYLI